jgi:O-glycosyl hydrolase
MRLARGAAALAGALVLITRPRSGVPRWPRLRLLAAAAAVMLAAAGVAAGAGPSAAADTATINGATTYQTMAGFGASEGFGEAQTVMNASSAVQQQTLACCTARPRGPG